jgi:Transposase DDE domain group 1
MIGMNEAESRKDLHPAGEPDDQALGYPAPHRVETMGGPMHVSWEEDPGISPHGMLTYFFEFLHVSGLWQEFVERCPLRYTSPNAPTKSEILGTILCSVLSGHRRYAHISGMRGDPVLPKLLGIECLRSEDSIRRAFANQDEDALMLWMDQQTDKTFAALLEQEWVLDLDATVKTLYGRQEEARVGYNPMKPGRPSHVYQVMVLAAAKLVLNVDVQAGNLTASEYAQPTLWGWLESRERKDWPTFLRGDIAHGNENMMRGAEERGVPYLFKLRQTKGVAQLIARLAARGDKAGWRDAGQGWQGVESHLQLQGWSRPRRVVVLRRRVRPAEPPAEASTQLQLPGCVLEHKGGDWYEHAVLVTSWEEPELLAVAQAYRDRADTENMFDELKNQWGWTGFSTQDLKRSQLMARIVALIYNWWSLFTRLASQDRHGEAITTRPLFLQGIARHTRHAQQNHLSMSSLHAKAHRVAHLLSAISGWLRIFRNSAEQLAAAVRWPVLLRHIFRRFCFGSPPNLPRLEAVNCRI